MVLPLGGELSYLNKGGWGINLWVSLFSCRVQWCLDSGICLRGSPILIHFPWCWYLCPQICDWLEELAIEP
jgi:hypothetical protein